MPETIAVCFGQFGPYHHSRVAALQGATQVLPVQIAAATKTYAWSMEAGAGSKECEAEGVKSGLCEGLRTLCSGTEEDASPAGVFFRARKLFKQAGVGIVFVPSYSPARYFALFAAAKSLGLRTVMMNESHAGTEKAAGWKKWIKRRIVKQFDAALVGGSPHKRHFAALGIPEEKIFTGYDAVDVGYFASRAQQVREAAESEMGWKMAGRGVPDAPGAALSASGVSDFHRAYGLPRRYFLNLGRMVPKKNLAALVAAYGRYCDKWRMEGDERKGKVPMALVLVGSGELETELEAQARSLGLEVIDRRTAEIGPSSPVTRRNENGGTIFFYGFRQLQENPVFYALADAFVLPSSYEEWGLVVNEAMACSLPVIVSRTAGCAEDLLPAGGRVTDEEATSGEGATAATSLNSPEERSNGFVFDPVSVEALAEALARIAERKDRRREMGKRSREIVEQFSCENFARQALAAAEAAMRGRGGGC